jgi:hypothetical protein
MPKTFVRQNVNEDQVGRGDCMARAITKASGIPYYMVREDLAEWCRQAPHRRGNPSSGVNITGWEGVVWMKEYGFQWYEVGDGFTIEDVPNVGRYVALMPKHAVAIVEGQIFDTGDIRKRTSRCMGFWLWVGTRLSR